MNELKVIDFSTTAKFEANGVSYTVEKDLSFSRYDYFTALCIRLAYGRDYDSIQMAVSKAAAYMDKTQFVKAAVELHNILEGIKAFPDRVNDAFAICALFINADGEDRGTYTGDLISKKINDWTKEGLSAIPFQHLAATLCGNLLRDWREAQGQGAEPQGETQAG
jgi:hypothetical protein